MDKFAWPTCFTDDNYTCRYMLFMVKSIFVGVLAYGGTYLMNTSILTVVLAGTLLAGQSGTQTWQNDYSKAQREGIAQKKPLMVVFGLGANGWTKVVGESTPSSEVSKLLADKYVCLYVDLASPNGTKLAQEFGIARAGFVISDHACLTQAFWHQGDMEASRFTTYLQQYAVPSIAGRGTETATTIRSSFYPSNSSFQGNSRTMSSANC